MWSSIVVLALSSCKREDAIVDGALPVLLVESPLAATFLEAGATRVTGIATAMTGVTVNGIPADVVDGRFEATLDLPRGITAIEVRGTDPTGHAVFTRHAVLAGTFAPAVGRVPDALEMRLNKGGLDHLGGVLGTLLEPGSLTSTLSAANPIYNYFSPSPVWPIDDTDVDVMISSIAFGPLEFAAAPLDGKLRLDLRLPTPAIEMQTFGTISYLQNTEGDRIHIAADAMRISADVSLDVNDAGRVSAGLDQVIVELPGFDASWDYVWGVVDWIAQLFLDLEVTVTDLVTDLLTTAAPPLLGKVLSALTTTFETELLGKVISLDSKLTAIESDAKGIHFLADLGVDMPDVLEGPGYLVAPPAEPSLDKEAQLSLALSDDFMNRMLYEAWSGGTIDLVLSTEDGSLDGFALEPLGSTTGEIRVTAGLPPVIVEREGRLEAQLGEIDVHIETPGGSNGNTLDVTLSGVTALELGIVDNALVIGMGTPELQFVVRDSDWGGSNESITNVLAHELPIDVLLLLLGDFSFPLPELEGFTIASAVTSRDASGVHTDVSVTLAH